MSSNCSPRVSFSLVILVQLVRIALSDCDYYYEKKRPQDTTLGNA